MDEGYEFFADRKLVTIFSAPNYCGMFANDGCLMRVAEDLTCGFLILKPKKIKEKKICIISSTEQPPNTNQHPFIKQYLKARPNKVELVQGEKIYADQYAI